MARTDQDQGNHRGELGDFLRSRRDRLKPEDAGLRSFGERRRVPGLRREELARLAGVSVDYYVRFEQGRAANVSDAVVAAVATALRLDGDETGHLHRLVRAAAPASRAASAPPVQRVRPGMLSLLRSMPGTPAFIVGRRTDVLAWNPLFATLITDFSALPEQQRNKAWLVFLHEETRGRFVNWETKARDLVAYLRLDQGRHPDDPVSTRLVDELSLRSAEFRRLWALHEVRDKTHGGYHLRHPRHRRVHPPVRKPQPARRPRPDADHVHRGGRIPVGGGPADPRRADPGRGPRTRRAPGLRSP